MSILESKCITVLLCLTLNSNHVIKVVFSIFFCIRWGGWHFLFIYQLYKFERLNILGFRIRQDIKKRVALIIENKLKVYKIVKISVPKYFIVEQFSIGRLILHNIWNVKKSLKQKKRSWAIINFYAIMQYT